MSNKVYYGEYSLKHWIDLMLSKNITLPKYQRSFVWSERKSQKLMEAFKENLFVPPVTIGAYIDSNEKEKTNVNLIIDGQQRLTSILLSYLELFPNKDYFGKPQNDMQSYQDKDGEDDSEQEENIITWTFSELLKLGLSKEEINKEVQNNNYKKLVCDISTSREEFEDFFESHYLGFSFLVPESNTQKNYYASVFREINTGGVNLLPQESRQALYYLDKNLKPFFDPNFTSKYQIQNKNFKMDFVRYLSLISQYKNRQELDKVAYGTRGKLEDYYINYIDSVIQDQYSNKFGKFSSIFPNSEWNQRIENVKNYLHDMNIGRTFNSIIDMDMFMFGLMYHVMFENKSIKDKDIITLKDSINHQTEEFKKNDKHAKSPNSLKYIRQRLQKSIDIYQEFINESA